MAIRLFVFTAQYRKPMDFSDGAISAAGQSWQTINEGLLFGDEFGDKLGWDNLTTTSTTTSTEVERFRAAVDDDFNFAEGLAILFELAKELRKVGNIITHDGEQNIDPAILKAKWETLVELAGVLGLEANSDKLKTQTNGLSDEDIESLLAERQNARANKDFATSDRIRDELTAAKITVIDKAGIPSSWYRG
jgi:cysteinyl-tRNA synthetase